MAEELSILRKQAAPADRRLQQALQSMEAAAPAGGPYRTVAQRAVRTAPKGPGLKTQIRGGIERMGQGMESAAEGAAAGLKEHLSSGKRMLAEAGSDAKRLLGSAGNAKKNLLESVGGDVVSGAKRQIMDTHGVPNTQMQNMSKNMGEHWAGGAIDKLKSMRPSNKALAGAGVAGLGIGALAGYGLHRARKRRNQDMQQAVSQGVQQALHRPNMTAE